MKRVMILLTVIILVLASTVAYAANPVRKSSGTVSQDLSSVKTFKFEHMNNGIGRGTCPVYTAPYTNAYRCANGKASCSTNSKLDIGGFSEQGWLLVRYSTNNGSTRVGWIPPKYVKGVQTHMYPHFSRVEQVAEDAILVTDNNLSPYDSTSYFAELEPGETYYVIGRYNYYSYDLWYIEFTIGDQVAYGFIPVD